MGHVAVRPRALLAACAALGGLLALLALAGQPAQALGEAVQPLATHVLEGEPFQVNVVAGLGDDEEVVEITCGKCGQTWTTAIRGNEWSHDRTPTNQRQKLLTFPSARFAGSAGQPRWADNWTITIQDAATPATGNVTVRFFDDWEQPNSTYPVSGAVHFRVAGVGNGHTVWFNISKYGRTGALHQVGSFFTYGTGGVASLTWRIPREHADDMLCPHIAQRCQDYTVKVESQAKSERGTLRAEPARLRGNLSYLAAGAQGGEELPPPLDTGPLAFNRTQNLTVAVTVKYLNNSLVGPWELTRPGNATLNGTVQLVVERLVVAQGQAGPAPQPVETLWAKWTPKGWRATWQIPRNLSESLDPAGNPQYRVRLPEQLDRWGNVIPEVNATPFKVHALRIAPVWLEQPAEEVERLTNATARFLLRYADGTPFTGQHNKSAMAAALLDATGDEVQSAALEHEGQGVWRMSFQPKIGFKPLGFYKLRLKESDDNASNFVVESESQAFEVVPARPRVELQTLAGHQARDAQQGFRRGEVVDILATVRYADGSAFNKTRLPASSNGTLTLNITRLDAAGARHGVDSVVLTALGTDGQWEGRYEIRDLTAANPLGDWAWTLEVVDREAPEPNFNTSTFVRPVHGAELPVQVVQPPEPLVRAGDRATMRFAAWYPNGTRLDEARGSGGVLVDVHPWRDGRALDPVARLLAFPNATRGDWTAWWLTDRATRVGEYVLAIHGQDVHGNTLAQVTTRPVTVFVELLQRAVEREPPARVHRGDTVLVVFDGKEGDMGEEGHAGPRIELQRWSAVRNAWEKERTNVRVNDTNSTDHVGRLETTNGTNLGLYRFAFHARNDQHARVNATSKAFEVLPVEQARAWLPATQDLAARALGKGAQLTLMLERREGDLVDKAEVHRNGELLGNATTLTRAGRFDVVWRTSFNLGPGPYEVVVRGRDVHGNPFVSSPLPLNFTGIELAAKVPAPPPGAIPRANRLELRVVVEYPDGKLARAGSFEARFVHANETVATRALENDRGAWKLNWTPTAAAPLGDYVILVSGDDGKGNTVRDQEVHAFAMAEGTLERRFALQRSIANRTENVVWVLPADANDTAMRFTLRDDAGNALAMDHTLSRAGDYVVTWRPAKDQRLGRYTLEAEGSDAEGNAIGAKARSLLVKPALIGVAFHETPASAALKPGEAGRWVFELKYADGTALPTDAANVPTVIVSQGEQILEPAPTLTIEGGKWVATWTPQPGVHSGTFRFNIGGKDALGNEIQFRFTQVRIDEGLGGMVREILGVPGFEAALLPAALLGAALLAKRGGARRPGRP